MKNFKKLVAAVLVSLMTLALVACGGSSSKNSLPGTWESSDDSSSTQYTFNEDGTGTVSVGTGITLNLTYATDGNKLSVSMTYLGSEQKDEYTYEIKDGKLVLTNSSGTTEYSRK